MKRLLTNGIIHSIGIAMILTACGKSNNGKLSAADQAKLDGVAQRELEVQAKQDEFSQKTAELEQRIRELAEKENQLISKETQLDALQSSLSQLDSNLRSQQQLLATEQKSLEQKEQMTAAEKAKLEKIKADVDATKSEIERQKNDLANAQRDQARLAEENRKQSEKLEEEVKAAQALYQGEEGLNKLLSTMVAGQTYPILVVVTGKNDCSQLSGVKAAIYRADKTSQIGRYKRVESESKSNSGLCGGRYLINANSAADIKAIVDTVNDKTDLKIAIQPFTHAKVRSFISLKYTNGETRSRTLAWESSTIAIGKPMTYADLSHVKNWSGFPTECASISDSCLKSLGSLSKSKANLKNAVDESVVIKMNDQDAKVLYVLDGKPIISNVIIDHEILAVGPTADEFKIKIAPDGYISDVKENNRVHIIVPVEAVKVETSFDTTNKLDYMRKLDRLSVELSN